MAAMTEKLVQPGWRLPRDLIEALDRAYHTKKALGEPGLTKSGFVADLIADALSRRPEPSQAPSSQATGGR
jgi:hypothetical protein